MEVNIKLQDERYLLTILEGGEVVNWDSLSARDKIRILYSFEWGKRTFKRHFHKSDKEV